jgi:hypothetical protein
MNDREILKKFASLGFDMRTAQKMYFKTPNDRGGAKGAYLQKSKKLEAEFDQLTADIRRQLESDEAAAIEMSIQQTLNFMP